MKKTILLIVAILMIALPLRVYAETEFDNQNSAIVTDDMLDKALVMSEDECQVLKLNETSVEIDVTIDGQNLLFKGRPYQSPYNDGLIFELSNQENSDLEIISAQFFTQAKPNRLILNTARDVENILQLILLKNNKIYVFENRIDSLTKYGFNAFATLPEEKIGLYDWWLKYYKPSRTFFDVKSPEKASVQRYNSHFYERKITVEYKRFDTEYTMDVIAELNTRDVFNTAAIRQRVYLYILNQAQYENGVYRDNQRALIVKDPNFRWEVVPHSHDKCDKFVKVEASAPTHIVRKLKLKFGGLSLNPFDWITIDSNVIGGSYFTLLEAKGFNLTVLSATDGEEIVVDAYLEKDNTGSYRNKIYVDIDFDVCLYNYHTVVSSDRMYISGYAYSDE